MKRIILIVTIALLPVLSACFVCRVPIHNGQMPKNLVLDVRKLGTLKNLKDDKGRHLFRKPVQEGFSVRYRVDDNSEHGEEQFFYAIGGRISSP